MRIAGIRLCLWLLKQGYSTDCMREHFCCVRRIARLLHKRGVASVAELTREKLLTCAPAKRLDDRRLAASVRLLERYFESETSLFGTQPLSRLDQRVADIDYELSPERLHALTLRDIEAFVRRSGTRLNRSSLQGMVAPASPDSASDIS